MPRRIGLISDTHGLLRPEAEQFLRGCEHIVHAGDIGGPDVLARLSAIAPVSAVRGNNDAQPWAAALPDALSIDLGGCVAHVLHDMKELHLHPAPAQARVIVAGHSHKPSVRHDAQDRVLVNPGSAGPRRFTLPVTAGELWLDISGNIRVRLVHLLDAQWRLAPDPG